MTGKKQREARKLHNLSPLRSSGKRSAVAKVSRARQTLDKELGALYQEIPATAAAAEARRAHAQQPTVQELTPQLEWQQSFLGGLIRDWPHHHHLFEELAAQSCPYRGMALTWAVTHWPHDLARPWLLPPPRPFWRWATDCGAIRCFWDGESSAYRLRLQDNILAEHQQIAAWAVVPLGTFSHLGSPKVGSSSSASAAPDVTPKTAPAEPQVAAPELVASAPGPDTEPQTVTQRRLDKRAPLFTPAVSERVTVGDPPADLMDGAGEPSSLAPSSGHVGSPTVAFRFDGTWVSRGGHHVTIRNHELCRSERDVGLSLVARKGKLILNEAGRRLQGTLTYGLSGVPSILWSDGKVWRQATCSSPAPVTQPAPAAPVAETAPAQRKRRRRTQGRKRRVSLSSDDISVAHRAASPHTTAPRTPAAYSQDLCASPVTSEGPN